MKKPILLLHFILFFLSIQGQVSIDTDASLEISGIQPKDNEVIEQSELTGMLIWAFVKDIEEVASVEFIVNNNSIIAKNTSEGPVFTAKWIPPMYGTYTFKIIATNTNGVSFEKETSFTIKHNLPIFCDGIIAWSNITYTTVGSKVGYNGIIYKNKWYAESTQIPGTSEVWEQIGTCSGYSTEKYCNSLPWSSSLIYDQKDMVYFENRVYKAKWWTQNNVPDTNNAWQYVSDCNNNTSSKSDFELLKESQTSIADIKVYNFSGKLIQTLPNEKLSSISTCIQNVLSDLKKDIYIYRFTINGKSYSRKIIKGTK